MEIIKTDGKLSFFEATSIIVGHGVGAGILSVPYLASRNSIYTFVWIVVLAFIMNCLLHLMIAELSYNNGGAHFVKCLENIFKNEKFKKVFSWIVFILLGFSVCMNVCSYITGSSVAVASIFYMIRGLEIPDEFPTNVIILSMVFYYILVALVVFFGLKVVGVSEKYSVFAMIGVMVILLIAVIVKHNFHSVIGEHRALTNVFGLYGMISFALSSVISVPQVVKGLEGDAKKIRGSIVLGITINIVMIIALTLITLIGSNLVTQNGAINDLSKSIGGWVSLVGYIFTLFALSTSLWANTLDLRDVVHEQTKLGLKVSWIVASLPCLTVAILATFLSSTFVMFAKAASVFQIITSLAVIVAYALSRKKLKDSPICGAFGNLVFQILVVVFALIATVGSVLPTV